MVAVPPTARLTGVLLRLTLPLGAPQLEPAEAVQVQEIIESVAGRMSLTPAFVTALGPALEITRV